MEMLTKEWNQEERGEIDVDNDIKDKQRNVSDKSQTNVAFSVVTKLRDAAIGQDVSLWLAGGEWDWETYKMKVRMMTIKYGKSIPTVLKRYKRSLWRGHLCLERMIYYK